MFLMIKNEWIIRLKKLQANAYFLSLFYNHFRVHSHTCLQKGKYVVAKETILATFPISRFYTEFFKPPFQRAKPGNGRLKQVKTYKSGEP